MIKMTTVVILIYEYALCDIIIVSSNYSNDNNIIAIRGPIAQLGSLPLRSETLT